MRDRLLFEDISILENLYTGFEQKIALKNDTPAKLAMNYLQHWDIWTFLLLIVVFYSIYIFTDIPSHLQKNI